MKKNMIKKALAVLVILAMMIPFMPVVASAELPAATENWYKAYDEADESTYTLEINNINDFVAFMNAGATANFENQIIELNCDIHWNGSAETPAVVDFTNGGFTNVTSAIEWTTIQTDFAGTFDGKHHTISGLYNLSEIKGGGLINRLAATGLIQNVNFENCYVEGYNTSTGASAREVGVVVNSVNSKGSKIENVTVSKSYVNIGRYVGAIVGYIYQNANCTMTNCVVASSVTLQKTEGSSYYEGAFAGIVASKGAVIFLGNCLNFSAEANYSTPSASTSAVQSKTGFVSVSNGALKYFNTTGLGDPESDYPDRTKIVGYEGTTLELTNENPQEAMAVEVQGVQVRASQTEGRFDARFIASVKIPEGKTEADVASISFEIAKLDKFAANGATTTLACTSVFTSITYKDVVVATAAEYEADYLAALVITGLAKDGMQAVLVRTCYTLIDGETVYASDYALVSFCNGQVIDACYVA